MAIQVAGELYESITGQLFEIGRQLRQPNGYPFDPNQLKIALQDAIEGRFGSLPKEDSEESVVPFLSVVATTNLPAVTGKPTRKCFTGRRWAYRDADFDNWLPASQPSTGACFITTLAPSRSWTFAEGAAAILGIGADTNLVLLGTLLIENGHTIALPQGEGMVEKTENGGETKMSVDGCGNFFFVETGDPENPVSVGFVYRVGRDWFAYVFRLVHGNRWDSGYRLLVRNLDASKLGL